MGITLQALLEVHRDATEYSHGGWEAMSTWEFNKHPRTKELLEEVGMVPWPKDMSGAAERIIKEDVGFAYRWTTLEELAPHKHVGLHLAALIAAAQVLEDAGEITRIMFYCC
jgi:hypothetical protein